MERITDTDSRCVRDHYPSLVDAVHYALHEPVTPAQQYERDNLGPRRMSGGTTGPGPGMPYDVSFRPCLEKLLAGETAGIAEHVARLRATLDTVSPQTLGMRQQPRLRRVRTRAGQGDELHITEAMQGRHDVAWSTTRRETLESMGRPRFATVHVGLVMNGSEDAETVLWRAAAATAVVDMLQGAGINVELILSSRSSRSIEGDSRLFEATITAKAHGVPMSREAVAALSSAAFFRSAFFHLVAVNSTGRKPGYGYGRAEHGLPKRVTDARDGGALVVDIPTTTRSLEAATRVLKDAVDVLAKSETAARAA